MLFFFTLTIVILFTLMQPTDPDGDESGSVL